jgi:hypothetical protein
MIWYALLIHTVLGMYTIIHMTKSPHHPLVKRYSTIPLGIIMDEMLHLGKNFIKICICVLADTPSPNNKTRLLVMLLGSKPGDNIKGPLTFIYWVIPHALLWEFSKQNFMVKRQSRSTKVIAWQHLFVNNIIYESMLFCWEWIILKWLIWHVFNCGNFVVCYSWIYAISHRKLVEDINRWFGGWWHYI